MIALMNLLLRKHEFKIYRPTRKGRLGIRKMEDTNAAYLAKQGRKILIYQIVFGPN